MTAPKPVLPTADLAFKRLTSSLDHPAIPQGLIADFLDIHTDADRIRPTVPYHISLLDGVNWDNPESVRRLHPTLRDITLDIDTADTLLEVQVKKQDRFIQRAVYYLCTQYASHYRPAADRYHNLRPIHMLNLTGFTLFPATDAGYHIYRLTDHAQPDRPTLSLLTLAVAEYNKHLFLTPAQGMWCHFLRTGQVPDEAPDYLREAGTLLAYINSDPKERRVIDLLEKYEADHELEIRAARKDGIAEGEARGRAAGRAEGEAKGLAEGEAKRQAAIARAMIADGVTAETIARYTGLTPEQIANLR
jgi:predicted transposase/invertase (TIGR01784 family)